MTSSIGMGLTLRKLTASMTKGATGNKLLLMNLFVSVVASGCANFANTLCMRYTEITKGISVYEDKELKKEIGISNKWAETAVYNTALSRVYMSAISLSIPIALMIGASKMGLRPNSKMPKTLFEATMIAYGLYVGLPISCAIFTNVSVKAGKEAEKPFHKYDYIYYSRGM